MSTLSLCLTIYAVATPVIVGIYIAALWNKLTAAPQIQMVKGLIGGGAIKFHYYFLLLPLFIVATWILFPYIILRKIKRLIFGKSKKELAKEELQKQMSSLMGGMSGLNMNDLGKYAQESLQNEFPEDTFEQISKDDLFNILDEEVKPRKNSDTPFGFYGDPEINKK